MHSADFGSARPPWCITLRFVHCCRLPDLLWPVEHCSVLSAGYAAQVVPSNYQVKGLHALVRDRDTPRHEFVFYADRLLRLVCSASYPGCLP